MLHLEHVLGVPTGHASLADDAARWAGVHDEAVADDQSLSAYVRMLERNHDRRVEAQVQSGDDIAAAFEQFLREQRPDTE